MRKTPSTARPFIRTVIRMNDICEECRIYGDDYSYDKDGDIVSSCYDCPMNPDGDAWMRGRDNEEVN